MMGKVKLDMLSIVRLPFGVFQRVKDTVHSILTALREYVRHLIPCFMLRSLDFIFSSACIIPCKNRGVY